MLLKKVIDLCSLIIIALVIAVVIASWVDAPHDHPVVKLLRDVTDPVLNPIRRALPTMGGIDYSPVVVLIGLRLLRGVSRQQKSDK